MTSQNLSRLETLQRAFDVDAELLKELAAAHKQCGDRMKAAIARVDDAVEASKLADAMKANYNAEHMLLSQYDAVTDQPEEVEGSEPVDAE